MPPLSYPPGRAPPCSAAISAPPAAASYLPQPPRRPCSKQNFFPAYLTPLTKLPPGLPPGRAPPCTAASSAPPGPSVFSPRPAPPPRSRWPCNSPRRPRGTAAPRRIPPSCSGRSRGAAAERAESEQNVASGTQWCFVRQNRTIVERNRAGSCSGRSRGAAPERAESARNEDSRQKRNCAGIPLASNILRLKQLRPGYLPPHSVICSGRAESDWNQQ